jgi:ascorbate-specific PTS system EIIC-type component UlaA
LQTAVAEPGRPSPPTAKIYGFAFVVGLCGFVFGALGGFILVGLLGHTSSGVINDGLHLSYIQFFIATGLIGFFAALRIGFKEARRKFLQ